MLDLNTEGRQYVVLSKWQGNSFQMSFRSWLDVEKYIAEEKGVYKIVSLEVYDIPLTGLSVAK